MSRPLDPLTQPLEGRCLIEASAGTGKTYAITSLVLRLLLGHDGTRIGVRALEIGQILVVTFTRAATDELRGRLRTRIITARRAFEDGAAPPEDDPLIARLVEHSHDRAQDLQRLRLAEISLDLASIFTIHGFAQRMLERNAFESGASFAAAVSEDDTQAVEQAIRDLWRERVYPLPQFAGDRVAGALKPADFLKTVRNLLPRQGVVFEGVPPASWEQLLEDIARAQAELIDAWQADPQGLRDALAGATLNKAGRIGSAAALAALERGIAGSELDATVVQGLSGEFLRSELRKKKGNVLAEHPVFDLADRLLEQAAQLAPRLLHDAVLEARTRLAAQKARTGALGFEDLLRLLDEGLSAPGSGERLAEAIRARYPAALIDECQDTDPLQWRVFGRIYERGGIALFLVGDPKQAIYGFRGADVYAYLQVRREAPDACSLDTNYRSVAPLVTALNRLFTLREDRDPFHAVDMPYLEVLPSHRPDEKPLRLDGTPVPPLQLLPFSTLGPLNKTAYTAHMAEAAADTVARMLNEAQQGRLSIGDERLRPQHIACLVRGWPEAEPLARALRRRGVPYVYRGRDSVYASAVAADLHRLLLAVLEPRAESRLRAALAGALLARSAAELEAWLADDGALLAWQERFLAHRERLREQGVQAMFRGLLFELEVPARLLAQPDGERRLTDCLHVVELLAEERSALDSDEALAARFAEHMASADGNHEAQQLRLESDADRVKIVTVHASKGLQYEFVLLPFVATSKAAREPLYHDADTLQARYDLSQSEEAMAAADRDRLAEELRLLYVGLTRAVHGCVIGVADVIDGRSKQSLFDSSAIGWLLDVGRLEPDVALAQLGERCGAVELEPGFVARIPEDATQRPVPQARVFRARIEQDWRASSYSALVRNLAEERAERVFRQPELVQREAAPDAGADGELTRFGFRRGAEYGNLLHDILQFADLAQPAAAPVNAALIRAALARQGLSPSWQPVVAEFLDELGGCALDGAELRLADIPVAARVPELGFELPFGRLTAGALNALLIEHEPLAARAPAPLRFADMRGMLSGSIDLVFEYQGRYFVADFKSNHLGGTFADYDRAGLERAIVAHRYDLQYTLYTLALVRQLRARLGERFDYERHIGGVYYLFLRGIRRAEGPASGVFFTRPARALIEGLDRLFAEGGA
jgi:exodeoxyribonuclease V beta subunit